MNCTSRASLLTAAVAGVALVGLTASVQADNLFFGVDADVSEGSLVDFDVTEGALGGANYFTANANAGGVVPAAGDHLYLGNNATITNGEGDAVEVRTLRLGIFTDLTGFSKVADDFDYPGSATLNVTGGSVTTNDNVPRSLVVGDAETGAMNVSGDAVVTSGGDIRVGVGQRADRATDGATGTLTVGGTAVVTANGALDIGGTDLTGSVTLSDDAQILTGGFLTVGTGSDALGGNSMTVNGGTVDVGGAWLNVGNGSGAGNRFTLNSGTVTVAGGLDLGWGDDGGDNSVTVEAGTMTFNGNYLRMAAGANSTGNTMTQNGGAVSVNFSDANGTSMVVGNSQGAEATYTLGGGDLAVAGTLTVGHVGTGTLVVNGGNLTAEELNIASFDGSVGVLNVNGNAATIDIAGRFTLGTGDDSLDSATGGAATLEFDTDGTEGVTILSVLGEAALADGSLIELEISSDPTPDDIYNLIDAGSILADLGAISFNGPSDDWSLRIIDGGNGQILQAVVPEPTSLALLGLGGLTMLRRRH